jgi:hypothetical protein
MKGSSSSFGFIIIAFAIIFAFKENPAEPDQGTQVCPVVSETVAAPDQDSALDIWWGLDFADDGAVNNTEFYAHEEADDFDHELENLEWSEALEN